MKKKTLLLLIVVLLLCGRTWATDYVDTLQVAGDRSNENLWQPKTFMADCYTEIDEPIPDDDVSYIYTNVVGRKQNWYFEDAADTSGKIIDSVKFIYRSKYTGGDDGTPKLTFWRKHYTAELGWSACDPYDTVTLTDSYVISSTMYTQDPCMDADWVWFNINYENFCWGVRCDAIRTGLPSPQNRVTWSILFVYSHSEVEEEAMLPRRRKILQIMGQ